MSFRYTPEQARFIAIVKELIATRPGQKADLEQVLSLGVLDAEYAKTWLAQLDAQTQQNTQNTQAQKQQAQQAAKAETILGMALQQGKKIAVKDQERQSGMYVLGVQGVGKSSLLESVIYQDICKGYPVIVLDPHGDLIDHVIAQMPDSRLKDTYVLDIEDIEFPFGVNLFHSVGLSPTQQAQANDRILHIFEKCFPETSRMLLEKYLGNIAPVFFTNPGYTMTDIPRFLRDDTFRALLLAKSRYTIREFWEEEYNGMSPSRRQTETASLATRLNRFLRSPIAGNIIGQSNTTIDFRKAIENREIILIRLPIKTLKEDASLIGTMLVGQIYAAIFSFGDLPLEKRPGFSLFVDEFQHFATSDFAEMFTEGRKFGSRVCVAHQFREQIPDYLASATLTARTIITFQTTTEDAQRIAPLFLGGLSKEIKKEDIVPDPVKHLLTYGHENKDVEHFIKQYLRPLQIMVSGNKVEVTTWEPSAWQSFWGFDEKSARPTLRTNPNIYLNTLLYEAQVKGNWMLPIPFQALMGCCNCGDGYYRIVEKLLKGKQNELIDYLRSAVAVYPGANQHNTADKLAGLFVFGSGKRDDQIDQLLDFLITLRIVMETLVKTPLVHKQAASASDAAQKIVNLPRRLALVKIGNDTDSLRTYDTPAAVSAHMQKQRKQLIQGQTRAKYCKNQATVEKEIEARRGLTEAKSQTPPAMQDAYKQFLAGMTDDQAKKPPRSRYSEVDEE
jgi:hypothetical protein